MEQDRRGSSTFTVYRLDVEADGGRSWAVRRRFSDFTALRAALKPHAGPAGLPPSWLELSRARAVTGPQRRACPPLPACFSRRSQQYRSYMSEDGASPMRSGSGPLHAFGAIACAAAAAELDIAFAHLALCFQRLQHTFAHIFSRHKCATVACRLSSAVVEARRALLEQCLQDVLHSAPPELRSAPPLLAFLSPAGQSPSSAGSPWRSPISAYLRAMFFGVLHFVTVRKREGRLLAAMPRPAFMLLWLRLYVSLVCREV